MPDMLWLQGLELCCGYKIKLGTFVLTIRCLPDKPGKLTQCIPIYGTILGQCTRNRANAGPMFMVCRV